MNATIALKKLQQAQALDTQAWGHTLRAIHLQNGGNARAATIDRCHEMSEEKANKAAKMFLEVEHYLERLA